MIITCNCGEKKFTLPDNSIPASGRLVQCGFCGLKWKQFPVDEVAKPQLISRTQNVVSKPQPVQPKIQKSKKVKKTAPKKTREISLYSPEYLAKKHGITLGNDEVKQSLNKNYVSFGFYNYLLLFLIIIIIVSRGLYFFQDFVVQQLPFTEFYIDYFFESIRNMFEIWKNLISNY